MGSAEIERIKYFHLSGLQTLFSSLSPTIVTELESRLVLTRYGAGSVIYAQGKRPKGIFLVLAGRIRMSAIALQDKTAVLKIAGPGEVLNLANCVAGEPHLTTAEATELSLIAFLSREELTAAMQKYPALCRVIAEDLAAKCMERGREILSLRVPCTASQRLAALLLLLARRDGSGPGTHLAFTHAELGQLIGASRETVTRLMNRFEDSAGIAMRKTAITIINEQSLEEIAGAHW